MSIALSAGHFRGSVWGNSIYAMTSSNMSRSSTVVIDPLSDVLSLIKPRRFMSGGIDAGGDWSFQFESSASA
jgi:hypothetical protein